jgi:group I intron endonuclease
MSVSLMKEEIEVVIYKTTNLLNGKIYVGQSKHNKSTYLGSGTYIKKAIKKYGRENFNREVLEYCETSEDLNERELYWIKKLKATDRKIGYNVRLKNQGLYTTQSRERQMHFKGKKLTDEHRANISKGLEGYKKTTEHIRKIQQNMDRSYMQTEEYRNNMSMSTSGSKNGMYGKKHTEETKQLISQKKLGNVPWNKGIVKPNYYKNMLENNLIKLQLHFNVDMDELISNIDTYVTNAKKNGLIPKNKGMSLETLMKYELA